MQAWVRVHMIKTFLRPFIWSSFCKGFFIVQTHGLHSNSQFCLPCSPIHTITAATFLTFRCLPVLILVPYQLTAHGCIFHRFLIFVLKSRLPLIIFSLPSTLFICIILPTSQCQVSPAIKVQSNKLSSTRPRAYAVSKLLEEKLPSSWP